MNCTEVKWSIFCLVERAPGTVDGEAWLENAAGPGYVPWKMCIWSLPFQACFKPGQDCTTIWNDPLLCQVMRWRISREEAAGICFFPTATKKQEVKGGKQRDLVEAGKKKAEDWVKPPVKPVLSQPLFHMEHWFSVLFDKAKRPETCTGASFWEALLHICLRILKSSDTGLAYGVWILTCFKKIFYQKRCLFKKYYCEIQWR